jgi:hypothetical protein
LKGKLLTDIFSVSETQDRIIIAFSNYSTTSNATGA